MSDALLVYDDDCGFCTWWAEFLEARSDVPTIGFSDLDPGLRNTLPDDYDRCAHLVTDGMRSPVELRWRKRSFVRASDNPFDRRLISCVNSTPTPRSGSGRTAG